MRMSLDDVALVLSSSAFCSLTSYELCKLTHATFDDSLKRRNVLKVLNQVK